MHDTLEEDRPGDQAIRAALRTDADVGAGLYSQAMTGTQFAAVLLPVAAALPLAVGVAAHGSRIARRHESLRPRRWEAISIIVGAVLLGAYLAMPASGLSLPTRVALVLTIAGALAANAWLIHRAGPLQRDPHVH